MVWSSYIPWEKELEDVFLSPCIKLISGVLFSYGCILKLEIPVIRGWTAKYLSGCSGVLSNMPIVMLKMKLFSCFAAGFTPAATSWGKHTPAHLLQGH